MRADCPTEVGRFMGWVFLCVKTGWELAVRFGEVCFITGHSINKKIQMESYGKKKNLTNVFET